VSARAEQSAEETLYRETVSSPPNERNRERRGDAKPLLFLPLR
jgi:hypothetical protein